MIKELWAVVSKEDGTVKETRGGSSTPKRIMVYESEAKAKRALNNEWIKQVIPDSSTVSIKLIYSSED